VRSASPAAVGNPYSQFDVFDALDLAAGIAGRQSRNLAEAAESSARRTGSQIHRGDGAGGLKMNFPDLEDCVSEDVLQQIKDPAEIAAEVSKLLNGLNQEDVFVVRRFAKEIAATIAKELAFKEPDMVEVVRKLCAVLEPMIAWLKPHGVNGRSLRQAMPINIRV
jgi:hypothetical protein